MKEIKEEAERHRKAKLKKYGADEKACGGHIKRAHGGKVEEHSDKKEDEKLLHEDLKPSAFKHRAEGGPIAGLGGGPKLGRKRNAGKKGTNVNVMIGKPGGSDGAPAGLPPALGSGPSALPPKPPIPAGPAAMPPRPMPAPGGAPAGPMKRGGSVHEKKREREHEKHSRHSGHRG